MIPTVKEDIGDEIDTMIERVKAVESDKRHSSDTRDNEELRKRRIILRNLEERENENIVERVIRVIEYLKIKDVKIVAAERKESKVSSRPGVVVATLRSAGEKEQVMKAKSVLRNSSRYKNVYIEHDIPSYHRKIQNNLHTIVNTLGKDKLHYKGTRVYVSEDSCNSSAKRDTRDSIIPNKSPDYRNDRRYNTDRQHEMRTGHTRERYSEHRRNPSYYHDERPSRSHNERQNSRNYYESSRRTNDYRY